MDDNGANNNIYKELPRALLNDAKYLFKKKMGIISLIPLFIMGVVAINYYYQYQLLKNNPQKVVQQETADLVAAVSKLIVLPDGEEPTVATVSDPEKLKDQPFFARASRGDKVLIYTNARKAILYSPEINKIIEVAPINIGNPSSSPKPTE